MTREELVEKMALASLKAKVDGDCTITDYLDYNAADAASLGVKLDVDGSGNPRWHGLDFVRALEQDEAECAILAPLIREALTALESAIPGLSDVLDGRAVIAPREPTEDMRSAALNTGLPDIDEPPLYEKIYRAMLSAAPNAKE